LGPRKIFRGLYMLCMQLSANKNSKLIFMYIASDKYPQ